MSSLTAVSDWASGDPFAQAMDDCQAPNMLQPKGGRTLGGSGRASPGQQQQPQHPQRPARQAQPKLPKQELEQPAESAPAVVTPQLISKHVFCTSVSMCIPHLHTYVCTQPHA